MAKLSPEFLKAFEKACEEFDRDARADIARAKSKPPPKPKVEATVLEWPKPQSAEYASRFQLALNAAQERWLERQRELEAEAASTCHRGPGDPDYWRR